MSWVWVGIGVEVRVGDGDGLGWGLVCVVLALGLLKVGLELGSVWVPSLIQIRSKLAKI